MGGWPVGQGSCRGEAGFQAPRVPQLIAQVIDPSIPRQRKMTLHAACGGFGYLQGLEQAELLWGGSADFGVGLVSDSGAVLLDTPELL